MIDTTQTRHTPGPWSYFYKSKYDEWHVSLPIEESSMKLALAPDGIQSSSPEADARLIAASPELLEALESMVREASMLLQNAEGCAVNHYGCDFELHGEPQWIADSRARIVQARAAISKAIGQ